MRSILEELWYSSINLQDAILEDNRYYKNLLSLMGKNREHLSDMLTEGQKEIL